MAATTTSAAVIAFAGSGTIDSSNTVGESCDQFYAKSWEAALTRCESTLEKKDHERALGVKSADNFRAALRHLQIEHPNESKREIISMLFPAVQHYETFAHSFVDMMAHSVDVSMLWGLLSLVVKLSLDSEGTTERINRMLRAISHKLENLNEILTSVSDHGKLKSKVVEINREIFMLWLNIIMTFRTQEIFDDPLALEEMSTKFDNTFCDTVKIVDSLIRDIQEMTLIIDRQAQTVDLAQYYSALTSQPSSKPTTLPCHTIPISRNLGFFGREDIIQEIEDYFESPQAQSGMSSLAFYGLGGVGKSQTALEYAWKRQADFDVVLWVPAENQIAVQQALSHVATTTLSLPGADPTAHNQNTVLVMEWLKTTEAKWLLVYDNVEAPFIFETYWPVSNHGSILITTRKPGLTAQPISKRIELQDFSPVLGGKFLVYALYGTHITEADPDFENARIISLKLSGHALAINQMAALIRAKRLSLEKFIVMYDKYARKLHSERKHGWTYPGYKYAIDTVWKLSFGDLEIYARNCLGILSLLMPDAIPLELFEGSPTSLTLQNLQFCEDEYERGETFEKLASHALIRLNPDTDTISIHRLIQLEFLFQMKKNDRQEAFDASVLLLLDVFPSRGESLVDERNWARAEKYLPQVLVLLQKYRDSQKEQEVLKSSLNLLNLICDTLWYLATNDSAGNRGVVLDTAYLAWDKWEHKSEAPLIHAYILGRGSDQDLWNGEFINAVQKARNALNIAMQHLPPDDERIVQYNSDYGIAFGSDGDYTRGANYLNRAEETFNSDPKRYGIAKGILINANISRNSYCNGDFQDAEERLNRTLEKSREMGSLYWEALIHFAFSSLGVRSGNLILAEDHVKLANETIEKFGKGRNIQLNGMYNYIAGRVRLDQKRVPESIEFLEKAIAIDSIQLTPRGYRARHLYALSCAQSCQPRGKEAAAKTMKEALELAGNIVLGDDERENWNAFDMLIRIVER